MKTFVSGVLAAIMAMGAAASGEAPAAAAPFALPAPAAAESAPAAAVAPVDYYRRGFYRNGPNFYYNGHRGYRYSRPGWRPYNGYRSTALDNTYQPRRPRRQSSRPSAEPDAG